MKSWETQGRVGRAVGSGREAGEGYMGKRVGNGREGLESGIRGCWDVW